MPEQQPHDLERLWAALPVAPAPVDRVLAAGRSRRRGARRPWHVALRRPLWSAGTLVALGGAFLAGTQVSGPGSGPGDDGPGAAGTGAAAPLFHGELVAAESCGALLDHYVERAREAVGPWGWDDPSMWTTTSTFQSGRLPDVALPSDATVAQTEARTSDAVASGETGTNVQEAGVDEPDVVKTDGETLWRVGGDTVTAYDVRGGDAPERIGELDLGAGGVVAERDETLTGVEVLVAGDTLVALGSASEGPDGVLTGRTWVVTVDVSDPARPRVEHELEVDSTLVTARLHGSTVRLVASAGLPDLDLVSASGRAGSERRALARNRALVGRSTIDDWLPTASLDGGPRQPLADCAEVAVPRDDDGVDGDDLGLDTVSVLGFEAGADLASVDDLDVTSLAAAASTAYVSLDHLYLATASAWRGCLDVCSTFGRVVPDDSGTTHVFDFELSGTGAAYVASGEVDGVVRDRWAMDEHEGVLRLAVGPSQETGDFNSVVTLRRSGDTLEEVGRVDGLGPDEDIQSVRWFDDLAIVVTFRQVDPLYTVDLTDQTRPRLLGKLKIPGFSSYLHPIGGDRLVGMGQGPNDRDNWAAQVGLFDVSDLTDPRRLDVLSYRSGTEALAGADPRQFTWLPDHQTALTVISRGWRGQTGWVSVLRVDEGTLTTRMVEADHGSSVRSIRTVPLPDGRVVLSTADSASYLDL